jgi:hypothetical protein
MVRDMIFHIVWPSDDPSKRFCEQLRHSRGLKRFDELLAPRPVAVWTRWAIQLIFSSA